MDKFDDACKVLHEGYDCAMIDNGDDGTCIPWEQDYSIFQIYSRMNVFQECTKQNKGNDCAIRSCTIELNFIFFLFEKYFQNHFPHRMNRHENGFVPNDECLPKTDYGEYYEDQIDVLFSESSNRGFVEPEDGKHACCGSKTYNTHLMDCCAPDDVRNTCL